MSLETNDHDRQRGAQPTPSTRGKGGMLTLPGKHHYDVLDGFLAAVSHLCSEILGRMGAV